MENNSKTGCAIAARLHGKNRNMYIHPGDKVLLRKDSASRIFEAKPGELVYEKALTVVSICPDSIIGTDTDGKSYSFTKQDVVITFSTNPSRKQC